MNQSSNQSVLSLKCPKHPKQLQQFIYILDTTGNPLTFPSCICEKGDQAFKNAFLISEIMDDGNQLVLSNFPPLSDPSLYEQIRKVFQLESKEDDDYILQSIEEVFSDLQIQIEKAINIAKSKVKQKYLKYFQTKNELQKIYNKISLTNQMRTILQEEKDVQKKISERIKSKILSSNLIKSDFVLSQGIEITKNEQSGVVIKSLLNQDGYKIAYLNFNLDPNKQQVFRVSISIANYSNAFILFGLIEDSNKDSSYLYSKNMCYCERGKEYGMGKVIKRGQLHKGNLNEKEINRSFEMRIYLKNKFVRVADFPNYSSVCQLVDTNRININQAQRFAVELYHLSIISITEILEVDNFDQKM